MLWWLSELWHIFCSTLNGLSHSGSFSSYKNEHKNNIYFVCQQDKFDVTRWWCPKILTVVWLIKEQACCHPYLPFGSSPITEVRNTRRLTPVTARVTLVDRERQFIYNVSTGNLTTKHISSSNARTCSLATNVSFCAARNLWRPLYCIILGTGVLIKSKYCTLLYFRHSD